MQAFLKKHGTGQSLHAVKVDWSITGYDLEVKFHVHKRSLRPWLCDDAFTSDWSKNWGLWNKDVVEVFIQPRKTFEDLGAPYLELQVSPNNRPFALIITEPRKKFSPPQKLHFTHEVMLEGLNWDTNMKFTLPEEFRGGEIFGNFFACLDHDPREYYALELNPESNPDFHRTELFLPLKMHE
jgi:hypothetical protein